MKDQRMAEQRMTDTAQDIPRRGQADNEEALVALINGHPETLFLMDAGISVHRMNGFSMTNVTSMVLEEDNEALAFPPKKEEEPIL